MILNTGSRTDIPAFFSEWFYNRIREGYVMARNPYYPEQILRYELSPEVVDCLVFCTKNPAPMLPRLHELDAFGQFWFVTITPYGKDIEPCVPPWDEVCESLLALAERKGPQQVEWRYDPILVNERYTEEVHIDFFKGMAKRLEGHVSSCVISFVDLYKKTVRNFPQVREVPWGTQLRLAERLVEIGAQHGIRLKTCMERDELGRFGIDTAGCMTKEVIERAIGSVLEIPSGKGHTREGCACVLGNDIGEYNTCGHGCLYCYANYDRGMVERNMARHDAASPLLIGHPTESDTIRSSRQVRYRTGQMLLQLF